MKRESEKNLRLVVVEDNQTQLRLLTAMVSKLDGVELVGTARDGIEALSVVREASPHLVLMDIVLPRRDGIAATRLLATRHPGVRVILVSALAASDTITRDAYRSGAAHVIRKPLQLESLRALFEVERAALMIRRKILIADDDAVCRKMLRPMLQLWGYDVREALDGNEAFDALSGADAPRLAIIDWVMPGIEGVELCRRLRRQAPDHYVYVILLTAKSDRASVVEGLGAGADDYLVKPFHRDEVRQRLRAGQRILEMQERLIAAQEALRLKASHDPLTGVLNREAIMELLERECARFQRNPELALSVLLVDVDRFKEVNDGHGHPVGDEVLRHTAQRMARDVRSYDAVGRYGGDEFLVVLAGADAREAAAVAERIRDSSAASRWPVETGSLRVTLSLGVASASAGCTAKSLVHDADLALLRAKRDGRDRVGRS